MRTVLALSVLLCASEAHADVTLQNGATEAGRIELRAGGQSELSNSARFADETPSSAITFGAGYFPVDNIQVGLGGSVGVLASSARAQEAYAHAAAFFRLPILRAFAGLRAGYYRVEVSGSDYMFDDRGPRVALDLGFRLAVPRSREARVFAEPTVTLSFVGSSSIHDERNSSYPGWTRALLVGVAVPVAF
jgi:hypothetical protein